MRRREFITLLGATAAWSVGARAQLAGKAWRIGYLSPASSSNLKTFMQGLNDLGYVDGKNIQFQRRVAVEVHRLNQDDIMEVEGTFYAPVKK
jgi:putative tryptophan/tyrosine transport system substrate-binding protein